MHDQQFDLRDKTILVTGGTGSFGSVFVPRTLKAFGPKKVIIYSRDEMKQWHLRESYSGMGEVRFFIGDVRDKERLQRAFSGVDVVVHAAATKIVPTAEYNPFEAVKTNVIGAMNVIDAALDAGVKRVVALSTDKASSPANLYGATKMTSDRLFTAANSYAGVAGTQFSVVRYGNVMGSRGSVIPYFQSLGPGDVVPITDEKMTRFMISLDEGVELVWTALQMSLGGEVFVKKIPSMSILDIAEAVCPGRPMRIIGIRAGEKIHEQMISPEDSYSTLDFGDHFRILSRGSIDEYNRILTTPGKPVPPGFSYTSDNNDHWMTIEELINFLSLGKNAHSR